jgi:hypothetical protein
VRYVEVIPVVILTLVGILTVFTVLMLIVVGDVLKFVSSPGFLWIAIIYIALLSSYPILKKIFKVEVNEE